MNSRNEAEIKEMRAREARAIQTILKLKAEIMPVLAEDIGKFPEREVRKRFVANPEFAKVLDDATVASIKGVIARQVPEIRDRVIRAMEEEERWLCGIDYHGPGKSLAENERLWEPTREVVEFVCKVLRDFGFPNPDEYPTEYKMPTWFIGGKYLPGLAEKYWACIAEVREARERIRELELAMLREDLGRRWDSVNANLGAEGGTRTPDSTDMSRLL